jgi:hypothetical protein
MEVFCDHGTMILAGLVGHLRGYQNFFLKRFRSPYRATAQGHESAAPFDTHTTARILPHIHIFLPIGEKIGE